METCPIDNTAVPASHSQGTLRLNTLIDIYLQEYEVRQFRVADARGRVKHVRDFFGDTKPATEITTSDIRGIKWHVGSRAPPLPL